MEFHPLAMIFPLMEGDDFEALVADIKAHGLIDSITTYEGQILDGRNRYRACLEAEQKPELIPFEGDFDEATAFVISMNIQRRHLNLGQRDACAALLANMDGKGRPENASREAFISQEDAAEKLHTSRSGVQRATIVREKAIPGIFEDLRQGKVKTAHAAEIALLPAEVQEGIYANSASPEDYEKNLEKVRKDRKRKATFERIQAEASPTQEWPTGRYSVIYADPPTEDDYGHTKRDTEHHYPTMTWEELLTLAVNEISTDDAVCYLWATPHTIHKSLEVLAAWGFEYRTHAVWSKDKIGLGAWFRNEHELLLVGRKGNFPPPPEDKRKGSVFEFPVGPHSAKPEEFAELIERWYPDAVRLELFRRGPPRPGWVAWGLETGMVAA